MLTTKDILKFERIKRNWTQEELAEVLHMSRGAYAQYETGANTPTTENIVKLAQLYNVTTDYLLCHDLNSLIKGSYESGKMHGEALADKILMKKRVRKKKPIED